MVAHLSMGQAGEFMGSSRHEPSPSPMLVAPSPVARSPPRLPSADHRLTIPERPSLASRRHISASLSPLHGSRPHRSSPLAGPSIAFAHDGTPKATSAPPTPSGGSRHLSPLAEFSTTAAQVDDPGDGDGVDSKKRRRRSLGAVLSKISFPSSGSSTSSSSSSSSGAEPSSPQRESPVRSRQRSRSASSRTAPPVPAVPPVPAWAHNTLPPRSMSPHKLSPSSSRAHTHSPGSSGSPKSSRPSSPTPSSRSTTSRRSVIHTPIVADPRTGYPVATRTTPSTSRNPEENWLTQSAAPRFSRLGLKAEGVVLPVSVREARRRSTASTLSIASTSRAKSFDALSPHSSSRPGSTARPSTVGHAPSSRMSIASTSTFTPSSVSHSSSSTPSHGSQSHSHSSPRHRSRTSSFASASSGRASIDCDTPSLTMSPGPSASDVSLAAPEVDEMGVLTRGVQLQLNDVPVGVIGVPEEGGEGEEESAYPAIRNKGKGRAHEYGFRIAPPPPPLPLVGAGGDSTASSIASVGSIGSLVSERSAFTVPWTRGESESELPRSERSSYFGSTVYLPRGHERAATAPALASSGEQGVGKDVNTKQEKEETERRSRKGTIGRMWRRVVRSVSARR